MTKWGYTSKAFIIVIIKTSFYLLKINKKNKQKCLCNRNFVTYFY